MTSPFLAEILEQPEALRRSVNHYPAGHDGLNKLAQTIQTGRQDRVILTGMGSSLYSCYPLWLSLNTQTALPATMWDASELIHFAPNILTPQTVLIAVSQSGESVELRELIRLANRPGISIAITNGTDNSLARWADLTLDTHAGDEAAVSTKTYLTTLAVLHLLGTQLSGQRVESTKDALNRVAADLSDFLSDWESKLEAMTNFLGTCESLAYMGRGPSLASVMTGALITEESSKVFCMGLSAGQFRHGPLELARPGLKAVMFAGSGPASLLNRRLAQEIGRCGGKCLLITPASAEASPNLFELTIPKAVPGLLPILEIVPVQLLTIRLAQLRGFEPAAFDHATKVTHSE
jgi:glucosamine--fructose-6-phosphate aminotransferase (isomerizing)